MNSVSFDPLAFLKSELSTEEIYVKVNAIHRLRIVSAILGPERVDEELIPYLTSLLPTQGDEVLFALAEELGSLQLYLDSPCKILPLLESLASADEYLVRSQAVASMVELAGYLPDYQLIHNFIASVLKLASTEQFTAKVSACKLFLAAYPRAGGFRDKLKNKLLDLCQDDNYIIRKAAAEEIVGLIGVNEKRVVISDILPIIKVLIQDDQEDIRILCIQIVLKLCEGFSKDDTKNILLPILAEFQADKSWKVRQAYAVECPRLCSVVDIEIVESTLIRSILGMLNDPENDVKIAVIDSLSKLLKLSPNFKSNSPLFVGVSALFTDGGISTKTKCKCIEYFTETRKLCDEEFCLNSIFPLIETTFSDTSMEIRLKIVGSLSILASLGTDFVVNKLKPVIEESIKDSKNWRLRKAALKSLTKIILVLGNSMLLSSYQFYLDSIKDPVCEIRQTVVAEMKELQEIIEIEWFSQVMYPKLQELYASSSWYLHRVGIIHIFGSIKSDYLGIFSRASKDPVANVRIAVCKVIKLMIADGRETTAYSR